MNPKGRNVEEKLWETKLRHNFLTNYLHDPDVHTFLFLCGGESNNVIREALRDYMTKHASQATEAEFQDKVFMAASMKVARGHRPVGSEILAEMNLGPVQTAHRAALPSAKAARILTPISASVLSEPVSSVMSALPSNTRHDGAVGIQAANEPVPSAAAPRSENSEQLVPKQKVVLDFGPEIDMASEETTTNDATKPSQRDKWLARHKF